jgi:hypothetical protein
MLSNLSPVVKNKPVIITATIAVVGWIYRAVDAAGNLEFLLLKLNMNEDVARFLGSDRAIDVFVALSMIALIGSLLYAANRIGRPSRVPGLAVGNATEFDLAKIRRVTRQRFINERVILDGHSYANCEFINVTFVYNGTGPFEMMNNNVTSNFKVTTESDAVKYTLALAKGLGLLKPEVPILGVDKSTPLPDVESPIYNGEQGKEIG